MSVFRQSVLYFLSEILLLSCFSELIVFVSSTIILTLCRGLDDLSCSQCVSLLKQLAAGGRTVICSIHTPSAKLFSMFDNVYVISFGQCTYQGYGPDVVPYLSSIGITCPTHYNPADFSKFLPSCGLQHWTKLGEWKVSLFFFDSHGGVFWRLRRLSR